MTAEHSHQEEQTPFSFHLTGETRKGFALLLAAKERFAVLHLEATRQDF